MWHTIFVAAHAVTATSALITGIFTLLRSRLFGTYLGSLVAMEMFLVLAVVVQWSAYNWPARAAFAALAALGGVVVWQGLRAWQIRPPDGASPSVHYYEHAGFTLVALVDAFLVVTVLNTGAPVWAVAATGVVVALAGHFALRIGRRWIVTDVSPSPRRRPMRQRSVQRRPETLRRASMRLPGRLAQVITHFDYRRPHPSRPNGCRSH